MAQRLLHRLLLRNIFLTIPMAQRVPYSFWKPLYLQFFSSYTHTATETRFSERSMQPTANTQHPKYCGHTGLLRKHKECKRKCKSNESTAHQRNMMHELPPDMKKSSKYCVGTQANADSTKNSTKRATMYVNVLQISTKYNEIQQCITKYSKVLQSITKYYNELQRTTMHCKVVQNSTLYYRVLKSIAKHHIVWQRTTQSTTK